MTILSHLKIWLYILDEIMLGFVLLAYIPWSQRGFNVDVEYSLIFFQGCTLAVVAHRLTPKLFQLPKGILVVS